jgi:hypothetical protein
MWRRLTFRTAGTVSQCKYETGKCNNVNNTVSNSIIVPPFLCNSYMRLEEKTVMGINIPFHIPHQMHTMPFVC